MGMMATCSPSTVSVGQAGGSDGVASNLSRLTERELDVLRLIAQGMLNKEIAIQLYISEPTVKNHTAKIYEKLEVRNRVEAVLWFLEKKEWM